MVVDAQVQLKSGESEQAVKTLRYIAKHAHSAHARKAASDLLATMESN
jgi:hypothetical protein